MRVASALYLLVALTAFVAGAPPTNTNNAPTTTDTAKPAQVRFDGQQVVRLSTTNRKNLADARKQIKQLNLDVWNDAANGVDVRVSPEEKATLARISGVKLDVLVQDVQSLINRERASHPSFVAGPEDWFKSYHPLNDLIKWYTTLAKDHPTLVSTPKAIGTTVQGRELVKFRITAPGDSSKKKRIWLQAHQHAREWISSATLQYIVHALVNAYTSNDARVVALLKEVEFVIVPVVNPDGYVYTWETNRLWRKNREKNSGSSYGVDLNRNWPDHWGYPGGDTSPSSDTYRGASPASSKEVAAAIAAYLEEDNVVGAIDFHSYSQLVLRPYGWTEDRAPDEKSLTTVSEQIAAEIKKQSGLHYTPERSVDLYYASGNVVDWWYGEGTDAKAKAGRPAPRPYAYCIELRPEDSVGGSGFILPPDQIIPTGKENYAAILTFAESSARNPLPDASKNPNKPVPDSTKSAA